MLISLVGTLSNSEENFKRETKVMSFYNNGDVSKALNVGKVSLTASRELTAMRAYILAAEGKLGECVFEYPQLYASDGLLPPVQRTSPLVPDSVYSLFGAVPLEGEPATAFLSRVASCDSATTAAKEYYLTSLLLEKKLIEFKKAVFSMCDSVAVDRLPKHYREALMLYTDVSGSDEFAVCDTAMHDRLVELRVMEAEYSDVFVRSNYVRRKFGDTYWWYFLYSN